MQVSNAQGVEQVQAVCAAHGSKPDELIEILHDLQHAQGFISEAAIPVIAKALNLSRAEVHGVVSFYHDFRCVPAGRHVIKLCRAEACQARGCNRLIGHAEARLGVKLGETTADGAVTLEAIYCLGNCALGPAALVDGALKGRMTAKGFDSIIDGFNDGGPA